jgi:hypothetical protein
MTGNNPKVLVEFSPEEIAWLADRLHEEWIRAVAAGAIASTPESQEKIAEHKKMEAKIRNRLLDNASKQGFGDL